MAVLNTISGVSNNILVGGSALTLLPAGVALISNIFTSEDKKPVKGIDGFLFDISLTESATYSAQITDHFTEENYTIQDHAAFDPVKVTLTGKVAELVYTKNAGLAFLSAAIDRLSPLGVISPTMGTQARQYIAAADQLGSALGSAKKVLNSIYDIFADDPSKNAQQKAFYVFEQMFLGRALLSIETPWKTYKNMMIENWTAEQSEESIYETTFTLTFKEMRFIGTETNTGTLEGRIAAQKEKPQDKGIVSKDQSLLKSGIEFTKKQLGTK
jgi:hypothetical protein